MMHWWDFLNPCPKHVISGRDALGNPITMMRKALAVEVVRRCNRCRTRTRNAWALYCRLLAQRTGKSSYNGAPIYPSWGFRQPMSTTGTSAARREHSQREAERIEHERLDTWRAGVVAWALPPTTRRAKRKDLA